MAEQDFSNISPQSMLMQILFGKTQGESSADAALNRSGSVMGSQRTQRRQSEARQGPALSTLSKGIDFANPINWMGGFGGGGSAAATAPMIQELLQALAKPPVQSIRTLGTKVFKSGPNLDSPSDAFNFLKSKIQSGELTPQQLQALSSPQGGRAGVLLPDNQMLFRATHGEAMQAVPEAFKGQVGPANQLMDVNTPFGRALLDIGSLDQLFQTKKDDPAFEAIANVIGQGIR